MRQQLEVVAVAGGLQQHCTRVDRSRDGDLRRCPTGESQGDHPFIVPGELVDPGEVRQAFEDGGGRQFGDDDQDDLLDELHPPPDVTGDVDREDTIEFLSFLQ